jgi:hypothetical protein
MGISAQLLEERQNLHPHGGRLKPSNTRSGFEAFGEFVKRVRLYVSRAG